VINSDNQLAGLLPQLKVAGWVAMDTEADSLHAYPQKLCLIQLNLPSGQVLVDPLAPVDLRPMFDILQRHTLLFHGADYDLRLLRRTYGFVPSAIFDTMEAARLLGLKAVSLTSLVARYLGVVLEKGPQKADWARRPLTPQMKAYALNDTFYLKPLRDILETELERRGRLEWLRETCARLVAACSQLHAPDPDLVWRVKGSSNLNRLPLGILRELWHWREKEAVAANRPPYFILPHERLIALAAAAAERKPIETLIPARFSAGRRAGLLAAVQRGLALPPEQLPQALSHVRPRMTEVEKGRFEALRQRRDLRARQLGIAPSLIASRATLLLLARDWARYQGRLMDWQRSLLE
jgi:ribonuclease D